MTQKGLEQRQSTCSVAGATVDTQAILISDLSGVEAVRILFAGAAEDTQTIISDLKVWSRGTAACSISSAAVDTQTREHIDDQIRWDDWRSDFVWSRGTAAYSISGGAVDTQTHELEVRGGQVEAGYINSTTEQKATMND